MHIVRSTELLILQLHPYMILLRLLLSLNRVLKFYCICKYLLVEDGQTVSSSSISHNFLCYS